MFKLIKRRLSKRNSGGFTLVEVVISCALLGILIVGVIMFVSPILNSVNSTNKNTRASNVAETVEYYISRSIRNAAYITVLTDTDFDEMKSCSSDIIKKIKEYNDNEGSQYSLKCISIRYAMDSRSQTYKYFICNETFDSGVLKTNNGPDLETMVFDPCYFDGIYPEVIFEQVKTKKEVEQPDGTKIETEVPAAAVKMTVNIYDSEDMKYKDDLIFSGSGYTSLRNIDAARQASNSNLTFNILDNDNIIDGHEKELGNLPVKMRETPDADHNETYIFYVERSLATGTPTPTT